MNEKSQYSQWLLGGLHLLLALTVPVLLSVMIGCMKATAKKEDLGPEVPSQEITNALARATQGSDLNSLAVGQYLSFSDTRRIENSESVIDLGGRRVEVLDRKDTTTEAHFTMRVVNTQRLLNGKFETTTSEDALWLTKVASSAAIPMRLRATRDNSLTAEDLSMGVSTQSQPQRITFHHLHESNGVLDAPPAVKSRANCSGLNPCEIPAHFLQFDMVRWQDATNYQKFSIDFAFTNKTPFIPFGHDFDQLTGVLIVDCRSTYVPVDSRTVYVRDCLSLDDFQK